jgi:hypothetical protein
MEKILEQIEIDILEERLEFDRCKCALNSCGDGNSISNG